MFRPVLGILSLFAVAPACADWFHTLIGYKCDAENNAVILTYKGAYNESGEEMVKNKGPHEWDPWSLTKRDDRGMFSTSKIIEGRCELKDVVYEIKIGPKPMNKNINDQCGAVVSAWAEVWQGSRLVLGRQDFEVYCFGAHPVTTEIVVKSGAREIVIRKVPHDEFYRWKR